MSNPDTDLPLFTDTTILETADKLRPIVEGVHQGYLLSFCVKYYLNELVPGNFRPFSQTQIAPNQAVIDVLNTLPSFNMRVVCLLITLSSEAICNYRSTFFENHPLHEIMFLSLPKSDDAVHSIFDVVKYFLAIPGFDPNISNEDNFTLLHAYLASERPDLNIVKLLINHKADLNTVEAISGATPLQHALLLKPPSPELVELLLESKADANAVDYAGNSVDDYAHQRSQVRFIPGPSNGSPNQQVIDLIAEYRCRPLELSDDGEQS